MSWDSANKLSIVITIGTPCALILRHLFYGIVRLRKDPSLSPELSEEVEKLLARAEDLHRDLQDKDIAVRMVINIRDPQFLVRFAKELGKCVYISILYNLPL